MSEKKFFISTGREMLHTGISICSTHAVCLWTNLRKTFPTWAAQSEYLIACLFLSFSTAQGKDSAVHIDGHVDQGIGVTCKSQGWFPQPEVIWLDSKGQIRKEKVVTQRLQTSSGLFDVVSSMALEPGTDMEVSCRIVSDILNTACESRVLVSGK